MSISKETKVGILAAFAITALAIGYNYLQGKKIFSSMNVYYGEYEKIEQLIESNPVLINGHKVGSVKSVDMDYETKIITVGIQIPAEIKIPTNSIMKITNIDMIGSKGVSIIFGDTAAIAADGDYLKAEQDQGIEEAITAVLTPLSKSVNHVLTEIDSAVAGADLESTLKDASIALRSFKETADKLNHLLDGKDAQLTSILNNVAETTNDLKGISPKIDGIITDIDSTSKQLAAVDFEALAVQIHELVDELGKTTTSINSGEGSLGMMVKDPSVYQNLDSTLNSLNALIEDINKYPKRYFSLTSRGAKKAEKQKAKDEETGN